MTKTITILAIATAFVIGTIVASTDVFAASKVTICHIPPGNPDNPQTINVKDKALPAHLAHSDTEGACPDDGGGNGGISPELQAQIDNIESTVTDIETDLLSKKSFYEVEDIVNFIDDEDRNFDILVSLSCPDSVPAEKQAFTIETMGVQVSHVNDDNQVAFFNSTVIDESFGFFYAEAISTFIGSELVSKDPSKKSQSSINSATTIGASEEVRFGGNVVNIDGVEEIKLKAAAIGQKPQGCDVTIDADAVHLGLPLPFP